APARDRREGRRAQRDPGRGEELAARLGTDVVVEEVHRSLRWRAGSVSDRSLRSLTLPARRGVIYSALRPGSTARSPASSTPPARPRTAPRPASTRPP